jgi:hypothetical protein
MNLPSGKSGGGDKDTWVCDDMTINTGRSALLEIVVLAAICFFGYQWFKSNETAPAKTEVIDKIERIEKEIVFFDGDGNEIIVPHISTKTK